MFGHSEREEVSAMLVLGEVFPVLTGGVGREWLAAEGLHLLDVTVF